MSESNPNHQDTAFHVQQAFKLALSMTLFYWFALWTNWQEPHYGALAIVIVSLGTRGATIEQGLMRMVGTTVGVLVGLLILALFNDSRWAVLCALSVHIALTCYGMQTSHYRYAWYAAGFIAIVIWADNYPNFGNAFYFSTFRWLQTLMGVVIYTTVDLVFWPRSAGNQLHVLGKGLFSSVQSQLASYRQPGSKEVRDTSLNQRRTEIAGQLSRTLSTLQDAFFDTTDVRGQRTTWKLMRDDLPRLVESLEMWHESVADQAQASIAQFSPHFADTLDLVDARLTRISQLWDQKFGDVAPAESSDRDLLTEPNLGVDRVALADVPHFERAAVLSAVRQLEILDQTSREILITLRRLNGFEVSSPPRASSTNDKAYLAPIWDTQRFIHAMFPVVTFVAAWMVWDIFNPPGSQKVAMIAGIYAILVVRTPMNPQSLWVAMIVFTAILVAPVCWLVMPRLSTGLELLTMIFAMTFFFGCLGAKSPALKSGPLIMFFVSAGISNQQSYSFQGPVTGSMMMLVGGGVLSVIYYLWTPIRPENALLRSLRRAFRRCSEYCTEFDSGMTTQYAAQARHRAHLMRAKINPSLAEVRKAVSNLDFGLYPKNQPDDWLRLIDSLQSLTYRLQSFDLAYREVVADSEEASRGPAAEGRQVMSTLSEILMAASRLETRKEVEVAALRDQLETDLSALRDALDQISAGDDELIKTYNLLGSMRMVIDAVKATQQAMRQVDCEEIATPRF